MESFILVLLLVGTIVFLKCNSFHTHTRGRPTIRLFQHFDQLKIGRYNRADRLLPHFDDVVSSCKARKNFSLAVEVVEKALAIRPMSPSMLTRIIKLCGDTDQLGRAVSLLKTMNDEMGIDPNVHHFGALIQACRSCKQWEMATALFERMDVIGVEKNTVVCNNLIACLGDAQQWTSVIETLGYMKDHNIFKDVVTYASAINACEKAGEWEHAVTLYRLMDLDGIKPNTVALNSVLNACGRGRQLRMALELFEEAGRRGIKRDVISYSILIAACGDAREFDLALRLFTIMGDNVSNTGRSKSHYGPSSSSSSSASYQKPTATRPLNNVATVATTVTKSSTPSSSDTGSGRGSGSGTSTAALATAFINQTAFDRDFLSSLLSGCNPVSRDVGVYNAMITVCEKCGGVRWKVALALINFLSSETVKARARAAQAAATGVSDSDEPFTTSSARKTAYTARKTELQAAAGLLQPDCKTYCAAISCCGKAGQWQHALDLFNRMAAEGVERDASVYHAIIIALQTAGQFAQASETMRIMQAEPGHRGRGGGKSSSDFLSRGSDFLLEISLNDAATTSSSISTSSNAVAEVSQRQLQNSVSVSGLAPPAEAEERSNSGSSSIKSTGSFISSSSSSSERQQPAVSALSDRLSSSSSSSSSSAEIFSQAQAVYAAGIADGKLRHWSSLVSATTSTTTTTAHSKPRQPGESSQRQQQPRRNHSIDSTEAVVDPAVDLDEQREQELMEMDLPKIVDLHGFPLSVAETVIDYVLSSIRKHYYRDRHPNHTAAAAPAAVVGGGGIISGTKTSSSITEEENKPPVDHRHHDKPESYDVQQPCNYDVHLIVGRGHHVNSSGTRGVLRSEIRDYVVDKYSGLEVNDMPGNDGCLVITMKSINEWLLKS